MASVPKKIWQDSYQLYIGGQWRDAEDGKTFNVYNPANGEFMCKVAAANKTVVDWRNELTAMVIYKITSLLNCMIYIGKTTRPLKERIGEHCRQKNSSLIDRAIQKHGIENFKIEILEQCETIEQLNEREIFWIAALNCKKPNGYNQTDGGDGLTGCLESTRKKLSEINTGKKMSDESRAKLSATQTEIANRPEEKTRRSLWMIDYYSRPGSIEKKSAEQKKRFENPAEREKMRQKSLGHKHKDSSKMKLSTRRKEKSIYPLLEAELERQQITRRGLAKLLNVSHTTIIKKLRGDIELDSATAIKIREVLNIETPLEELFRIEIDTYQAENTD